MNTIVKTVDLSGFEKPPKAVGYEGACQKMLWSGIKYLSKTDTPEELFKGMNVIDNERISVFGICTLGENAKELEKAVTSSIDGCSGAQHHAVMGHLKLIAQKGVLGWLNEFKDTDRIFEIDLDSLMTKDTKQLFDESPKAKKMVKRGEEALKDILKKEKEDADNN
jgi:hypothetical protein